MAFPSTACPFRSCCLILGKGINLGLGSWSQSSRRREVIQVLFLSSRLFARGGSAGLRASALAGLRGAVALEPPDHHEPKSTIYFDQYDKGILSSTWSRCSGVVLAVFFLFFGRFRNHMLRETKHGIQGIALVKTPLLVCMRCLALLGSSTSRPTLNGEILIHWIFWLVNLSSGRAWSKLLGLSALLISFFRCCRTMKCWNLSLRAWSRRWWDKTLRLLRVNRRACFLHILATYLHFLGPRGVRDTLVLGKLF